MRRRDPKTWTPSELRDLDLTEFRKDPSEYVKRCMGCARDMPYNAYCKAHQVIVNEEARKRQRRRLRKRAKEARTQERSLF